MLNYLSAERIKWRRRYLWIVLAALAAAGMASHFAVPKNILQQAPETIINGEMIFVSIYPILYMTQITAAAILGCILFSQEYQHNTWMQIKTFPISPVRYILAKLIWQFLMIFLLSLGNIFSMICVCVVYKLPVTGHLLLFLLIMGVISSILAVLGSMLFITLAVLCKKNIIIPVICAGMSVMPILLASMGTWHISKGSFMEVIMQYIYPPTSSTQIYMEVLFRFVSAAEYGMQPAQVNVPLACISFAGIAAVLFGIQIILLKREEI